MNKDPKLKMFLNRIRMFFSGNFFRKLFRALGISNFLKSFYFRLAAPKDGVVDMKVAGLSSKFFVKNYSDLIYLSETIVGVGDERQVIETLLDSSNSNDVFYDIGAFIGVHTMFVSQKCSKVIAFEPSARSYEILGKNIELNGFKNIVPINIALGESHGEATMSSNDLSVYKINNDNSRGIFNEKVRMAKGDELVDEKKLPLPNIVKIDVEGYEYSVIKGLEKALRNSACRLICCEVHPTLLPAGITADKVIDLIKDLGFTDIKTYDRGTTFHIFCYKR